MVKIQIILTFQNYKRMEKKQRVKQLIVNLLVAIASALGTFFGIN